LLCGSYPDAFGAQATAARWQSAALRKIRDALYLQRVSVEAFMRRCDSNGDGRVSGAELQRAMLREVRYE
jgi:hypothetical protein